MRSWQSFIVENLIKILVKQENPDVYLERKKIEDNSNYILPTKLQQKYKITKVDSYLLDTYLLKSPSKSDTRQILYLPGGGYVEQPLMWHWRFLYNLSQKLNGTITVPIYPKAPNHQYDEVFENVLPIYKDLLTKTSPENIVIMGDSAGGGLSLALSQMLLKEGLPQPGNIVLLSPWLDITLSHPEIESMKKNEPMLNLKLLIESGKTYAGDTDRSNYLLSPINGPLKGLGKITLFIGTHEFFLPDARKFKKLAEKEKIDINYFEYPKMNHVFPVLPIPEAKRAMQQIVDILKS
ncbi:alpha/beta hydrolase [Clostridium intestinale]|uniref:alpha/beta hydrolase n=1 Tax=Clostridium intestinale TaxID=36845 RepID=UPI002DD64551|nr:alpha/beta hydrolase [Clostridium intestinale]WRY52829.1 alpha/beta hydrolase [Clostridium intestinale]